MQIRSDVDTFCRCLLHISPTIIQHYVMIESLFYSRNQPYCIMSICCQCQSNFYPTGYQYVHQQRTGHFWRNHPFESVSFNHYLEVINQQKLVILNIPITAVYTLILTRNPPNIAYLSIKMGYFCRVSQIFNYNLVNTSHSYHHPFI